MTALNKQALREMAERAASDSWGYDRDEFNDAITPEVVLALLDEQIAMVFSDNGRSDAEFIAVASPVAVLSLLDENLQLQRDKDSLEAVAVAMRDDMRDAREKLEAAEKRIAELEGENEYIRNRFKEADRMFGKNILIMRAAIIEWQATGNATTALAWIYNTLWGPGELPSEDEKDAQAYFDREYAPIDEELMALHKWFWEQSEAERAAAGIGVKGE